MIKKTKLTGLDNKKSDRHCGANKSDQNKKAENSTHEPEILRDDPYSCQNSGPCVGAELIEKRKECDQYKDGMLRALADLDNYKKRTAQIIFDTRSNTIAEVVEGLLPILDNFEFGLMAAKKQGNGDTIVSGLQMILQQLQNWLLSYNISEIFPLGEKFDMRFHDCVRRVEDASYEPGTIAAVDRKGYKFGEKLLRPAIVAVACQEDKTPKVEQQ